RGQLLLAGACGLLPGDDRLGLAQAAFDLLAAFFRTRRLGSRFGRDLAGGGRLRLGLGWSLRDPHGRFGCAALLGRVGEAVLILLPERRRGGLQVALALAQGDRGGALVAGLQLLAATLQV